MRKSIITFIIMVVVIAVTVAVASVVATVATVTIVYAQNTTTTAQQTNYNNITIPQIKDLSPSIIIDAINTKVRSIYIDNGQR